jgi:DNA-binding XRE family transcriptional regulator
MKDTVRHYGNWVKWHRSKLGLSQQGLGAKIGIGGKQIYNIEKQKVPSGKQVKTAMAIARVFGVPEEVAMTFWKTEPRPDVRQMERSEPLHRIVRLPLNTYQQLQHVAERDKPGQTVEDYLIAFADDATTKRVTDPPPASEPLRKPVRVLEKHGAAHEA